MQDIGKSITKATLIFTLISAGGKLLGMARESALAAFFGASADTDAYKLALGIPSILLGIIVAAISTTFIPVYTEYLKEKTEAQTRYFLNNIVNIALILCFILLLVGFFAAPFIIRIIAPSFEGEAYNLTVKLTIISFPNLIFFALYYLGCGYLQANKRFTATALTWVVYDMVLIFCIMGLYKKGIEAVTVGSLIAASSLFLVQVPSIIKSGYKYKLVVDFKNEGFQKMAILIGPIILSTAFNQLYIFIDRMLATGLDEGSLSALDYAYRLNSMVYNVFILSLVTVLYPSLSAIADNIDRFRSLVSKGIRVIILIGFPTMLGFYVLRVPIINLLFERGEFNQHDTLMTSTALGCFAFGIIGVGLNELLNRAFFSLKDTKTPTINGILTICINIVLNVLFVKPWGVGGLALATSISAVISGVMLIFRLRIKIHYIHGKELFISLIKSGASALIMGVCVYFCYELLNNEFLMGSSFIIKTSRLFMSIGAGVIVYIAVLFILKVEELQYVSEMLVNRFPKIFRGKSRLNAQLSYWKISEK